MVKAKRRSMWSIYTTMPWWCSCTIVLITYALFIKYQQSVSVTGYYTRMLVDMAYEYRFALLAILLIPSLVSLRSIKARKVKLSSVTSREALTSLSWQEFESVVAQAYKGLGYDVEENAGPGADGGVDVVIHKDGKTHLIQCKHWKARSPSVSVIRELFGIMISKGATSAIVVTTGRFTKSAYAFAQGKAITLIDGVNLGKYIASIDAQAGRGATNVATSTIEPTERANTCPVCSKPLVIRTVKQGTHRGHVFTGCSAFPTCRFTRES